MLIISAFLNWYDYSGTFLDLKYTGIDLFNDSDLQSILDASDYDSGAKYAGLIALISGIVVILLAALNFLKMAGGVTKYADLLNAILAIVALGFAIWAYTWEFLSEYPGTGLYLCIAGAVISFIGSVIPFCLKSAGKA